ncbi:hypothetical protein BKA62DRAFT_694329 [Auriculariales sp. MPI-PUGE-AT-0066]|nr:hypothetical protein BKA62DRAFT_694329 [Auriculariales sp. MPI-PUGE-AT-0066]
MSSIAAQLTNARSLVKRFRVRELKRPAALTALAATPSSSTSRAKTFPLPPRPRAERPSIPNPFLYQRSTETGRWQKPKYSLRRQAELVKAARLSGTLHLLPPGAKLRPSEIADFKKAHEDATRVRYNIPAEKTRNNRKAYNAAVAKIPEPALDEMSVVWTGRLWDRQVKGSKTGSRLYSRKKYMFKGHRWEKVFNLRQQFVKMRLRSQKRRIRRWHASRLGNASPFAKAKYTGRLPY